VRDRDHHGSGGSGRLRRAQVGNGRTTAWSLANKAMNSSRHGQSAGSRRRRRRPCATRRPGREKKRSRQAFKQAIAKPPRRPIQRQRLCASTFSASQAALAPLPARHVVEPQSVLGVADHVLDHGVLAVVGFQLQHLALAIGDEGVVAVGHALQPELGAGRGLYTALASAPARSPRHVAARCGPPRAAATRHRWPGPNASSVLGGGAVL
jgi:hypothetical protein